VPTALVFLISARRGEERGRALLVGSRARPLLCLTRPPETRRGAARRPVA